MALIYAWGPRLSGLHINPVVTFRIHGARGSSTEAWVMPYLVAQFAGAIRRLALPSSSCTATSRAGGNYPVATPGRRNGRAFRGWRSYAR